MNLALAKKAEIEGRVAALDLSPAAQRRRTVSAIANLGGAIVALGTLIAGILTAGKWLDDQAREREARAEAQFSSAIALLASSKASDHAAAVVTLSSYISRDQPARNQRVLLAVANAIPAEQNYFAQRTMVEFFNTLDYRKLTREQKPVCCERSSTMTAP